MLITENLRLGTALIAAALCLVLGSNLLDLWRGHGDLEKSLAQQETALAANTKIQAQLEALASGTQALADRGNANAKRIVATLHQNGINIKHK